ncbi:MAG: DUF1365 domain-containing protein, partial [Endozoicomonas sp.]
LDLDELPELDKRLSLFSVNRFNLVSFHFGDYGDRSTTPLRQQIEQLLQAQGIPEPDHIRLLCYPRILGYAFNPLSVYFCYEKSSDNENQNTALNLTAVVYEVSNTFRERHSYVMATDVIAADPSVKNRPAPIIHQMAEKRLHVSPFFPMECAYRFKVMPPAETISLGIDLNDSDGRLFSAVFKGRRQPVNDQLILKIMVMLPLQTLKVIGAIHWEALRLWLKGLKIFRHSPRGYFFSWSRGASLRANPQSERKTRNNFEQGA